MLRGFTDSTGVEWRVWEVFPTQAGFTTPSEVLTQKPLLPAFANGWLCFESAHQKRRLAPIPQGWEFHDGPRLEQMCREADPVQARRREHVVAEGTEGLSA
jgi:hypothetical protein